MIPYVRGKSPTLTENDAILWSVSPYINAAIHKKTDHYNGVYTSGITNHSLQN